MDWIEEEGKSVEEALERALNLLGAKREDVVFEVLQERSPLLGFFGNPSVQIRVARKQERNPVEVAVEVVNDLLRFLTVSGRVEGFVEERDILLNIESDQGGLLIGHHGETIEALQYLVSRMVNRTVAAEERIRVVIDTEGYRQRQIERLERLARKAAQQVRLSGEAVTLAPMNARDRRIVHLALQGDCFVETVSIGDRDNRRIMISPNEGRDRGLSSQVEKE